MDKKLIMTYLKAMLNGCGYAAASSTAIVWAFPKLAKRNLGPKARIICGMTGLAWCMWQMFNYQEKLEDEIIEAIPTTVTFNITEKDEAD